MGRFTSSVINIFQSRWVTQSYRGSAWTPTPGFQPSCSRPILFSLPRPFFPLFFFRYPRPKFRFFAKAPSPSYPRPRPYFAKSFLYCDFLNFLLSESWLCTMSRGQTDYPWFIHQRLGVLFMAPISLIFDIIHLNSTCWQSPSRKIKSNNMNWWYKGPGHQKLWFSSFPLKNSWGTCNS